MLAPPGLTQALLVLLTGLCRGLASNSSSFHFLAANSMACYQGDNYTKMLAVVELYRNTPWATLFGTAEVQNGSCPTGYMINTTTPEDCAPNISLTVFLDLNATHNYEWARAERLALETAAAGNASEAPRILERVSRQSCTKPQITPFMLKLKPIHPEPDSTGEYKPMDWELGRTAALPPRRKSHDLKTQADEAMADAMRAKEMADDLFARAVEARAQAEQAAERAKTKQEAAERQTAAKAAEAGLVQVAAHVSDQNGRRPAGLHVARPAARLQKWFSKQNL